MVDAENFEGEIIVSDEIIYFCKAQKKDISALAKMYKDIAINSENYQEKFSPQSEERFEKTGGMFIVHDAQSIKAEMEKEDSFFIILTTDSGTMIASLWVTRQDPSFLDFIPERDAFMGHEDHYQALLKAINDQVVAYPREIIISKEYKMSKTPLLMVAIFSYGMQKNGYTHSLGEIYKVCSYKDKSGSHYVNQLNYKSYNIIDGGVYGLKIGTFLGAFSPRRLDLVNFEVAIESHIFSLDFSQFLPTALEHLNDNAIEIKFKGDYAR